MPCNLSHFAINCDDLERAKKFYGSVFGWKFNAWGPPGFFQATTGTPEKPGVQGALQGRRQIVPGKAMYGPECTFSVDDVDAIASAAEANGGKVVMSKVILPTVGTLIFVQDTEGNIVGAMQYDRNAG